MTTFEVSLAQAYLALSGQDPVMALVRSVRDLARLRRHLASRPELDLAAPAPVASGARLASPPLS